MTGRERILRTISGQPVDRPACFYRATRSVTEAVRQRYGLRTADEVPAFLGSDAVQVVPAYQGALTREGASPDTYYDLFGNLHKVRQSGDLVSDHIVAPVLAEAESPEEIARLAMPGPEILDIPASLQALEAARADGLAVYGGIWATILSLSRNLIGEENLLVHIKLQPALAKALIEKVTDYFLRLNEAYLTACGRYIDVYYFGIDLGTQRALYIGKEDLEALFFPSIRRVIRQAHAFDLPVMFHSCGAIAPIIGELIKSGVDMLDPVQVDAAGMTPDALAAFRGQVVFHGGVSTQNTLPFGAPEDVVRETRGLISALSPGLVVAPDQEMIGRIPPENIRALFETVKAIRNG